MNKKNKLGIIFSILTILLLFYVAFLENKIDEKRTTFERISDELREIRSFENFLSSFKTDYVLVEKIQPDQIILDSIKNEIHLIYQKIIIYEYHISNGNLMTQEKVNELSKLNLDEIKMYREEHPIDLTYVNSLGIEKEKLEKRRNWLFITSIISQIIGIILVGFPIKEPHVQLNNKL